MSTSRSPSAVRAGSEVLRRYRDERGRGDPREGGELHDILFGDTSQEEGAGPSSPYYDGSTEFSTENMSTPGGRNVPKANNDMKTPATSQPSETSNRTLLKVYMANQLELNEADMESYEAVVNELAEQLTEVTRIKNELTMNIIQLHNEKDEMIREKTEEWSEQKSELVMQINELQGSIDEINMLFSDGNLSAVSGFQDKKEFIDHLKARAMKGDSRIGEIKELEEICHNLRAECHAAQLSRDQLLIQLSDFKDQLEYKNLANQAADALREEQQQKVLELESKVLLMAKELLLFQSSAENVQSGPNSSSVWGSPRAVGGPHGGFVFEDSPGGEIKDDRMSPGPGGFRDLSAVTNMVRKNDNHRMQMQLDLDETEACHYEDLANGLLEKIGRITEERDDLQILFEQVQKEREDLLLSIEGLKVEGADKDEEMRRASALLDDMQGKIAERDLIIVRIKAERDEAVALMDSEGAKNYESDIPSIGDEVLLQQLQLAEERLQNYELLLQGKNDEVAFAEASLVEIQTLFEEARRGLPQSGSRGVAMRMTHKDSSSNKSDRDRPPISSIPFDLEEGSEETWGASESKATGSGRKSENEGMNGSAQGKGKEKNREIEKQEESDVLKKLRGVVEEREKELQSQYADLSAMRVILSEEKDANNLLEKQKMSLREMTESLKSRLLEVDGEMEKLATSDRINKSKVLEITDLLRLEVERNEENGRAMECLEALLHTSQSEAKQLYDKIADQNVDLLRLENATESQKSQVHSPAFNKVDQEISLKVKILESFRDELQMENDRLLTSYKTKASRVEELTEEATSLKNELDAKDSDLDELRSRLDAESAEKIRCEQLEADIFNLREISTLQEARCSELNALLVDRDQTLEIAQDESRFLRDVLSKVGEKDESSVKLLVDAEAEKTVLQESMHRMSVELQAKKLELQDSKLEKEKLHRAVLETITEAEEKERTYEHSRFYLESELALKTLQLSGVEVDVRSHVSVLTQRLEDAMGEKSVAEDALRKERQVAAELSREQTRKASELAQAQRYVTTLVETIQYYSGHFQHQEEQLSRHVSSWVAQCDDKIKSSLDKLHTIKKAVALSTTPSRPAPKIEESSSGMSFAVLEEKLFFTQASLTSTIENSEQLEQEHKNLWQQLQQSLKDQERLEKAVKESRMRNSSHRDGDSVRERDSGFVTHGPASLAGGDDFNRLSERLMQAETRAVQMSAMSAKSFAQSARTIAYLEGENGRLKTMLDHFRLVNDKMMNDIRIAREEGMNQKCLEHRLKLTAESEVVLQERLRITESQLRAKERDAMLSLQQIQEQGEIREGDIMDEMNRLTEKSRILNEKVLTSGREIKILKETIELQKESHQSENKKIQEKLEMTENSLQELGTKFRESEQMNKSLRSVLRDKEDAIAESENFLTQKQQEQLLLSAEFSRKSSHFTEDSSEQLARIRTLETAAAKMRGQIAESDAANLLKDELLASALAKQVTANDESRYMRGLIESQQLAAQASLQEILDLKTRISAGLRDASEIDEKYAALSIAHSTAVKELAATTETVRAMEEEIEVVTSELRGCTGELLSYRESLDSAELLINSLQSDLQERRAQDHALQIKTESFEEENFVLKQSVQNLKERLASATSDVQTLQETKSMNEEEKEIHVKKVRDLEMTMMQSGGLLGSYQSAESELVKEIERFFKSLDQTSGSTQPTDATGGDDAVNNLFTSPVPGVAPFSYTNSEHHTNAAQSASEATSPPLTILRKQVTTLKGRAEDMSHRCAQQEDSIRMSRKDIEEYKIKIVQLEHVLQRTTHEKQVIESRLSHADEDILHLRATAGELALEKEMVTTGSEDMAQKVRGFIRDIDGLMSDALSRSHTATGGKIIMRSEIGNPGGTKSAVGGSLLSSASLSNTLNVSTASSGTSLEIAAGTMLPSCACDIERSLDILCSALEAVTADTHTRRDQQEKVVSDWAEKEKAWEVQRAELSSQIVAMEEAVRDERVSATGHLRDVSLLRPEIETQKELLAEFARNNAELELEYKAAAENNGELRTALSEAENLCLDLRGRTRTLQIEDEKKSQEIEDLSEQIESMRKRAADTDFEIEKGSAANDRLRAEKDALDNVRRSMEAELDRCRLELSGLRSIARDTEQDGQATFEVEKLLGALKTTMDQVTATAAVAGGSTGNAPMSRLSPYISKLVPHTDTGDQGILAPSLSNRVDAAVARLGEFRTWTREDAKIRRGTEEKVQELEQEVLAAQNAAEDTQRALRKALLQSSEREAEVREKMKEITELRFDNESKDEEIEKLRKEDSTLGGTLEIERRSRQKQLAELHTRDGEILFLRSELEGQKMSNAKTLDQVSDLKQRLDTSAEELEEKGEQLRVVKAHNLKLNVTLEQLERGSEVDTMSRLTLEKRVGDSESLHGVISSLRAQLAESENAIKAAREHTKIVGDSKAELEGRHAQAIRDLEANRKVLYSAEIRHNEMVKEKSNLVAETLDLRTSLSKAKERTDQEYALRLQMESNVEALKRASNETRMLTMDSSEREGRTEQLYAQGEEEKKTLRSSLVALQNAYDEKERARLSEVALRQRADADLAKYKSMMDKANYDLSDSTARAKALRTEGRKARKQVLECVGLVRDLVYLVQLDVRTSDQSEEHSKLTAALSGASGIGVSPIKMRTFSFDEENGGGEKEKHLLGLCEALGMTELAAAVEGMKELIPWLRDMQPKLKIEQEATLRRLENERNRLARELAHAEEKGEDKEKGKKQRDEIRTLENQLLEARRREVDNSLLLARQASVLEEKLEYERDLKQIALLELEKSKIRGESLSRDLEAQRVGPSAALAYHSEHSETLQAYAEMDRLKRESQVRDTELRAVEHHRDVLRDTVEQLERQVRVKTDALADNLRYPMSVDGMGQGQGAGSEEEEVLRRQIGRYQARCAGMDELVSSYRAGVLALYADGSSYGAAQYAPFMEKKRSSNNSVGTNPMYNRSLASLTGNKNNNNNNNNNTHVYGSNGWIEREIYNIKKSYEEEIKLLEAETGELRGKLRQSGSYISELRKRFEDNMKAMYRPAGRGQASETLALQFEHMSSSLEQAHTESQRLDKELSIEKTLSRRRHGLLVDDLTAALQGRDAALAALARLEALCADSGIGKELIIEACHIDERDKEGGRDVGRERDREEYYPRASGANYTAGRNDDGTAGSLGQEERKALQSLMRGLAESDVEVEGDRRGSRKRREITHTQISPNATKTSTPNSAEKDKDRDRDREREREQERREAETRDRERAQLDRLKEERDKNKASSAKYGGNGSMVALTAHAHSAYGRDNYTPLAPGVRSTASAGPSAGGGGGGGGGGGAVGEYVGDRPSLTNLFSPAMRYISPMKAVAVTNTPAPFVVRHATSDFITQPQGDSRGGDRAVAGSPSVSYPLNTVRASELGGGSMRISRSATQTSAPRKMSSTMTSKKE